MTVTPDDAIKQKQRELHSLNAQLEELRCQFARECGTFAAEWYQQHARSIVVNSATTAPTLSDDDLKRLKDEIAQLGNNAQSIADQHLSDKALWWHLHEHHEPLTTKNRHDAAFCYEYDGTLPPTQVDKAVRFILGHLGPVLNSFGLLNANTFCAMDYNSWREHAVRDQPARPNERLYCPNVFEWSADMKRTLAQYSSKKQEAVKKVNDIYQTRLQNKKALMQDRWESHT